MSFLKVFKREFDIILKTRIILIMMILVPLVMSWLICEIFKSGSPSHLPIAVLNEDNSELSRKLIRMIDATPSVQIKYNLNDLLEGKNLITEGKVYAILVIPKYFQKDISRLKQPKIVLYYNNQMILIGGIISKDLTKTINSFMVGMDVKTRMKQGLPKDLALIESNLITVDEHIRSNPYMNYQYFLSLTAFGHIFQLLIVFISIWAVGIEFKQGTSKKWLEMADNSITTALFGKLLPYFIVFLTIMSIVYFMYFVIYSAPFVGNVLFLIISTIAFILTCQILGTMFVAITKNLRLSLSCGSFYTAMGFAFAGVTFPIIGMPLFAKIYSALMPLSHFIKILIDQSLRGIPVYYDLKPILALFILYCVGAIFIPRLKRVSYDEESWFKF